MTPSVFGALAAGLLALFAMSEVSRLRERRRVRRRLATFADTLEIREAAAATPLSPTSERVAGPIVTYLDARYPLAGGVRTALTAAGAGIATAALLIAALAFFGVGPVIAVPAVAALAAGAAWLVGRLLEQRQHERFQQRFLVATEDLERMVRFGISAPQALASGAASAEEPVRSSLRKVLDAINLGVPLAAALGQEAHRVRVSEMAMLAAIVSTQSSTGGGLAESVSNLAQMLRERLDNRTRLRAATSEPKVSLLILMAVPFVGVGLQAAAQPDLIDTLLESGRHLLGIGAGLIVAGLLASLLIVRSVR